jgi:hypothetical protein
VSEAANRNFSERAWASRIENLDLINTFFTGLLNSPYFFQRAFSAGTRVEPFAEGLAYLLLKILTFLDSDGIPSLLQNVMGTTSKKIPDEVIRTFLGFILFHLQLEVRDVCVSDCTRIFTELDVLSKQQVEAYWNRLKFSETEQTRRYLQMEDFNSPCRVGFELGTEHHCPIVDFKPFDFNAANDEYTYDVIKEKLSSLHKIVQERYVNSLNKGQ